MRDELLSYYERELVYLRQMSAEFGEKYPKIASRLLLEPGRCEDPHVERLIESFALLAARVHLKLDDEFPEITQALLNVLYPHYVRPIPSSTIVQFRPDSTGKVTSRLRVPRGTVLYSKPVEGMPCRFRTSYETDVWPLRVADARFLPPDRLDPPVKGSDAVAALKIELAGLPNVKFEELGVESLRFYLDGESHVVHALYELLFNNASDILLRNPAPKARARAIPVDRGALRSVGFEREDCLLPYPRRSFDAHRLLQEYFSFPEKFFFFDVGGLEPTASDGFVDRAEIVILFSSFEREDRREMLESAVSSETLRLGCSPAANLFEHTAEPIALDQTRYDYPVVPDYRRREALEVFSVDRVTALDPRTRQTVECRPFYSFSHAEARNETTVYWQTALRRPIGRGSAAPELYLNLVDHVGRPRAVDFETLTARCTCTNGDLPAKLPFGDELGDLETEGGSAFQSIVALHKPTRSTRPPTGQALLWRLVSHLSLNYLSVVEEGKDALQQILRLYDFSGSTDAERQINGVVGLDSSRGFSRVVSEHGISYVRGVNVTLDLDEERFVGGGVYLFAAVLERFFGQYVTLNSFSRLTATTRQRKEPLRQWPPRAGNRILA